MVFSSLVLLVLVSTIGRHKKLLPAALARGLCKSVIYQSTTVDGLPLAAAARSEENMFKTVCRVQYYSRLHHHHHQQY